MDENPTSNIELQSTGEMTTAASVLDDNLKGFGEKEITFFGGWSLLLNNITGPGMPLLLLEVVLTWVVSHDRHSDYLSRSRVVYVRIIDIFIYLLTQLILLAGQLLESSLSWWCPRCHP